MTPADSTTLLPRRGSEPQSGRTSQALALSALAHYRALHHRLALADPDTADDRGFSSGERWLLHWAAASAWIVPEEIVARFERLIGEIRDAESPAGIEWLTTFPRAVAALLDRRGPGTPSQERRRFGDKVARPTPRSDHPQGGSPSMPAGAGSR